MPKADFPNALVSANDAAHSFKIGASHVEVWFTRTSDGRDMDRLRALITSAKHGILFLLFTPGAKGLHTLAGQRANDSTGKRCSSPSSTAGPRRC